MGIISFGGISSTNFGIEVSAPPRYIIPEEDISQVHINGKNGDSMRRWKSYKNVKVQYSINALTPPAYVGDINMDGVIDINDYDMLDEHILDPTIVPFDSFQGMLADVNKDGAINDLDRQQMQFIIDYDRQDYSHPIKSGSYKVTKIAQWLHPYYSKSQLKLYDDRYRTVGTFRTTKDGYVRLTDSYNPNLFRKAICKSSSDFMDVYEEGIAGTIEFECTPEKWYTNGEVWTRGTEVDGSNRRKTSLYNFSGFPSWPIFRTRIHEASGVTSNDVCVLTITNIFAYGTYPGSINLNHPEEGPNIKTVSRTIRFNPWVVGDNVAEYTYIDCDRCSCYHATKIDGQNEVWDPQLVNYDDHLLTKMTRDTGVVVPGWNVFSLVVNKSNGTQYYPTFSDGSPAIEILPRWWTL